MANDYGETLGKKLAGVDVALVKVLMLPARIFICGGPVKTGQLIPQSLRDRIVEFLEINNDPIANSLILAESFTDYFQSDCYNNLLQFEEDIAEISTLVVICLESAGSLVELGMFCNHPSFNKKLLVFAPSEHVHTKDSFIFLGPLESLKKHDRNSVSTFPFPKKTEKIYPELEDVITDLKNKIENIQNQYDFNPKSSGHICLLIHDIVSLAEPIKKNEIKTALTDLGLLDIKSGDLTRYLYLLDKMNLVKNYEYSNVDYYYCVDPAIKRTKFGIDRITKLPIERQNIRMAIRETFIDEGVDVDEASKKRRNVAKRIFELRDNS